MIGNDKAIEFCKYCGAGLREDGYCEVCENENSKN